MAENTFFKRKFTKEETEECFTWFEEHLSQLPTSVRLTRSINFPNLQATIPLYLGKLRNQLRDNTTYSGQIAILFMLRDHIKQMPDFQE